MAQSVSMPSLVQQHNHQQQQRLLEHPALPHDAPEGSGGDGGSRKEESNKGLKGVYGNALDFNRYHARCCCIALAPHDGNLLATSWGTDIHVLDLRQLPTFPTGPRHAAPPAAGKFAYSVDRLHTDEITALQFVGGHQLCSAGEDLMVNFVDLREAEDDMLLAATRCGEVANRMHYFEDCQGVGIVGSCENAYWFPTADVTTQLEDKIERPDFSSYMVDWFQLPGAAAAPYLMRGVRDDDGNAGVLEVLHYGTKETAVLPSVNVHREMTRVVMGIAADKLVTASEDGVVAFWQVGGDGVHAAGPVTTSDGPEMTSRDGGQQSKRLRF
ncbi:hypothetical protein STCU_05046 [Strigomonas culicis]|uniref:Guanine nucleotide-binding protein subunit beta-like protein n=1 Tax=Strigomonas culicis TaxID=28005 RepID=S9UIH3_9TRYP|nr:hypothetical protein STCU_05046 [Strigomonas culicis]|eukprot:EPY28534.1 hypothetical protein STCU_05046 [Strigomonas culicis]